MDNDSISMDIQCDFPVSEKRKEVWNIEIDMLEQVKKICKNHEISYFAICGTLLGTIRHDGFIPWDDDIDIGMLRTDYEKFVHFAKKELQSPYYIQLPGEDTGYFYGHAKLRNSDTTAIRKRNWKTNQIFNQGIFIDIFPIDNVPDDLKKRKKFLQSINRLHRCQKIVEYWYAEQEKHSVFFTCNYVFCKLFVWIMGGPCRYFKKYDMLVQKYNSEDTKEFGIISEFVITRFIWEKANFKEITEHSFEKTSIAIPKNYEPILKQSYGEWNKMVRGGDLHGAVFYDTQKSYREYLGKYELYSDDKYYIL